MTNAIDEPALSQQSLAVPADLQHLATIRSMVRRVCESAGMGAVDAAALRRGISELELAVTELVSNVIRHGHEGDDERRLQIHVSVSATGAFAFELIHNGRPFDGKNVDITELNCPQEGGMGLYLISECVDDVTYGATPNGASQIQLFKNLFSISDHGATV